MEKVYLHLKISTTGRTGALLGNYLLLLDFQELRIQVFITTAVLEKSLAQFLFIFAWQTSNFSSQKKQKSAPYRPWWSRIFHLVCRQLCNYTMGYLFIICCATCQGAIHETAEPVFTLMRALFPSLFRGKYLTHTQTIGLICKVIIHHGHWHIKL